MDSQKTDRVFAFIDGQNLNMGPRSQGWILDFRKFRKLLGEKYGVSEAFYFIGQVEGEEVLYERLESMGYRLIFKPTTELPDETVKGNVDAELVLHTMIQYPNYDKAIIVSGDGDFYALLEYLEGQGKLFKVIVPSPRFSGLLRKFSDYIVRIDRFQKYLDYRPAKKPPAEEPKV
jgi:uncharacterized LabA/DUF88 family protein